MELVLVVVAVVGLEVVVPVVGEGVLVIAGLLGALVVV